MYRVMCQVLGMRACVPERDVVDPRGTPTCGVALSSIHRSFMQE